MKTLSICLDDVGLDLIADVQPTNIVRLQSISWQPKAFYTYPVCSPTRSCFYSREYGFRTGIGIVVPPESTSAQFDPALAKLPPGPAATIGKWHLAGDTEYTHARDCGFEFGDITPGNPRPSAGWNYTTWPSVQFTAQGPPQVTTEGQYATLAHSTAAINAIEFGSFDTIALSFNACHFPYHSPPGYAPSWDKHVQVRDMLRYVDDRLGEILGAAVTNGYRILLWSDNGTPPGLGGGKASLYESGINNLCVAHGFGALPDGALLHTVDLLALVDGDYTGDAQAPGTRQYLYSEAFDVNGTPPDAATWRWAMRDARWKLVHNADDTVELYDLDADPTEQSNVAATFPADVARLEQAVADLQAS